jgi:predicted HTH domain antitoxin
MPAYQVTIPIPQEVLFALHKSLKEAAEDIQRQAAIRYYTRRQLSLGKAAEFAGMTRFEFIDYLRFNNETIFDYTDEELAEIQQDAALISNLLP